MMSRRIKRTNYTLDSKGIASLDQEEIIGILRAADAIIFRGGRNQLAKILKGSKDKKLIELKLDKCPYYGFYKLLTIEKILARVDWMIIHEYLAIEYDGRLPLIVYTEKGWEIEKDTYTNELLEEMKRMIASRSDEYNFDHLKDKNRGLIWLLIDKIQNLGDENFIPLLESWARIDYKKVAQRLNFTIKFLKQQNTPTSR
jgi:hypothetical protein